MKLNNVNKNKHFNIKIYVFIAFILSLILTQTKSDEIFANEDKDVINVLDYRKYVDNGDWSKALQKAHDEANRYNKTVVYPRGEYYLNEPLGIQIKTDVDFSQATIKINENNLSKNLPFFKVVSNYNKINLIDNIDRDTFIKEWKKTSTSIPSLKTYENHFVVIEDKNDIAIKRISSNGIVNNSSYYKKDFAYIDKNGKLLNKPMFNFNNITSITAYPVDKPINIKGGTVDFVGGTNKDEYCLSFMTVQRSNTTIDGFNFVKTDDVHSTSPITGSIYVSKCFNINIKNVSSFSRKYYSSGTYIFNANTVENLTFEGIYTNKKSDEWSSHTSNYIKNMVINNSEMDRIDTHFMVQDITVKNTTLNNKGVAVNGQGKLIIENCNFKNTSSILDIRGDYGSSWDGDIIMRNINILNPTSVTILKPDIDPKYTQNDFGFNPVYYGNNILLENINVDNMSNIVNNYIMSIPKGDITLFKNKVSYPKTFNVSNINSKNKIITFKNDSNKNIYTVNGNTYFLKNGEIQTGFQEVTINRVKGEYYFMRGNNDSFNKGKLMISKEGKFINRGNSKVYIEPTGLVSKYNGIKKVNGSIYLLNNGEVQTGFQNTIINGVQGQYYFTRGINNDSKKGALLTSKEGVIINSRNNKLYLDSTGKVSTYTGIKMINGNKYIIENGIIRN